MNRDDSCENSLGGDGLLCPPPPPFYFSDAERENSPPTKSPAPIGHFSTFSPTVNFSFARQLLQKCEELYIQSGPVTMEQANKPQD